LSGSSHLTRLGLPDIEVVPYGLHACHFYESAADLEDALVKYFAAGLRNRERCYWVTAEPVNAGRARAALQKAGFDVAAEEHNGALVIKDHAEWYTDGLKSADIVKLWLAEEERATALGFNGLRITGNVTFLTDESWSEFMEYEQAIDGALDGRRIIALCTYRDVVGPSGMLDVVRRHDCALERRGRGWQVMSSGPDTMALPAAT
jgi:two-component system, LuxR family, sensor kinase FixL